MPLSEVAMMMNYFFFMNFLLWSAASQEFILTPRMSSPRLWEVALVQECQWVTLGQMMLLCILNWSYQVNSGWPGVRGRWAASSISMSEAAVADDRSVGTTSWAHHRSSGHLSSLSALPTAAHSCSCCQYKNFTILDTMHQTFNIQLYQSEKMQFLCKFFTVEYIYQYHDPFMHTFKSC